MKVAAGLSRWRKSRGRGTPTLPGLDTTTDGKTEGGGEGGGIRSDARSGKEDPRLAELRVKMRAVHKLRAEQAAAARGQDDAAIADDKSTAPRRARLKLSLEKEEQAERYPGARGSIFHQWHRQHTGHQTNPQLRKHDLMEYLGDPDHAYCILHRHDRIAEKKRREKLKAARAAQTVGRQEHHGVGHTLVKRGGGQTVLATEREKLRKEWLDAKEVAHERLANPWPKPPPTPEPLLKGSKKQELTTGEKLFLKDEADNIFKRHHFDIYRASLQELQIGLAMWNSLKPTCSPRECSSKCCHTWYEAEARRRDARDARDAECQTLVNRLFHYFDKDGSGSIDRIEMLKLIEAVAVVEVELTQLALGMPPEEARRIAGEQLAPERIAATFFSVLAKMDKDDDEEITSAELLEYFKSIEENECQLESPFFEVKVLDPLRELGTRTFNRQSKHIEYGKHGMLL
jgi:hypothetical protein|eukprot:COSAG02_NODE_267_length_26570_cov_7.008235_19_plen_458_part_00